MVTLEFRITEEEAGWLRYVVAESRPPKMATTMIHDCFVEGLAARMKRISDKAVARLREEK